MGRFFQPTTLPYEDQDESTQRAWDRLVEANEELDKLNQMIRSKQPLPEDRHLIVDEQVNAVLAWRKVTRRMGLVRSNGRTASVHLVKASTVEG